MVVGRNFTIPATQQISFVPSKKSVSANFIKNHNPQSRKNPLTISILGHPKTWETQSGELILTKKMKEECLQKVVRCSGHAALIVGYDLNKKNFLVKIVGGEDWGNKGYGTISFDYIDQMSPRYFLTGSLNGKIDIPDFRN